MGEKIRVWIKAFRLRTLPLALACVSMGGFLAAERDHFSWSIFTLCLTTTVFLQILSNLANDYGDALSGVDGEDRKGPARLMQSGVISKKQMTKAMVICTLLSFVSGLSLLLVALGSQWLIFTAFLILGFGAIYAAIKYTAGKDPYGYAGYGDLFVFLFFGIVGVAGTYYLFSGSFHLRILLPATSCGAFAAAVLNVNNIRDIQSDKLAGKLSIPVRIGRPKAVVYHWFLLFVGLVAAVAYMMLNFRSPVQLFFLITIPLLYLNGRAVLLKKEAMQLDPFLKQMVFITLAFVLFFGISLVLN